MPREQVVPVESEREQPTREILLDNDHGWVKHRPFIKRRYFLVIFGHLIKRHCSCQTMLWLHIRKDTLACSQPLSVCDAQKSLDSMTFGIWNTRDRSPKQGWMMDRHFGAAARQPISALPCPCCGGRMVSVRTPSGAITHGCSYCGAEIRRTAVATGTEEGLEPVDPVR